MEKKGKITIFETDTTVEKISEFLLLADELPVFTQDRHYMFAKMPTPSELADRVRIFKNQYLVNGEDKTVWVHRYPENLEKVLRANEISFTKKEIEIPMIVEKFFKKGGVVS